MRRITITHQLNHSFPHDGFAAITTMLIVSAVTLSIAITTTLGSVTEAQNSLTYKKGFETVKIAESCAEESLIRLRDDSNYAGGNLSIGNGTCTITVSGGGSNRTISIIGTLAGPPDFTRRLELTVKRTGQSINLLTWQELP